MGLRPDLMDLVDLLEHAGVLPLVILEGVLPGALLLGGSVLLGSGERHGLGLKCHMRVCQCESYVCAYIYIYTHIYVWM